MQKIQFYKKYNVRQFANSGIVELWNCGIIELNGFILVSPRRTKVILEEIDDSLNKLAFFIWLDIESLYKIFENVNKEKELHLLIVLITHFVDCINKEKIIIYPQPEGIDTLLGIDTKELLIKFSSLIDLPVKKNKLKLFKLPFNIIKLIIAMIYDIIRK